MYGLLVGIEVEGDKVAPLDFIFQHHFPILFRNGHIIFHVGFQIVAGYRLGLVTVRVPVRDFGSRVPYDFPDVSGKESNCFIPRPYWLPALF